MTEGRRFMLSVRLTAREHDILFAVAEAEGLHPSEFVREAILDRVWGGRKGEPLPTKIEPGLLRFHDAPRHRREAL